MENWEYKLAGEFKARNNPKPLGACIGKVESLEPVIISIQSGKFMLQANQIYVCNQILERETTFRDYIADQEQSGSFSCTPERGVEGWRLRYGGSGRERPALFCGRRPPATGRA